MAKEIPVYLFVGFLESGKTKFIQETFEDPNFDSGDKTLLLVCEEGEEEYNEKKFAFPGVTVKVLEDKSELNPPTRCPLISTPTPSTSRMTISASGIWTARTSPRSIRARPSGSWRRCVRPTARARTASCRAVSQ